MRSWKKWFAPCITLCSMVMPRWVLSFETRLCTASGDVTEFQVAVYEQSGSRAGRQEREVVVLGEGRDGDEARNFRASHQELHGDPGAEGDADDPADLRILVVGLEPIERRRRVGEFTGTVLEHTLAAADAAEIETEDRKTAVDETIVEGMNDGVVHGPPKLGMRVKQDGDWRGRRLVVVIPALDAPGGTVENDLWHRWEVPDFAQSSAPG